MRKFITYADRILHVHHPRVVVETAIAFGASRDALFEYSELTPQMLTSPEMRVSYHQYAILCANALRQTKVPELGIHVGKNTGIAQMGVLGFLLPNSPTLGAALDAILRYGTTIAPAWDLQVTMRHETAILSFSPTLPFGPLTVFAHEVMLAAFDTHARSLYGGRAVPVTRLEFPFPRPAHADEYRKIYDVPMSFDCDVARVEFDASVLNATIPFSDPAAFKIAEQFCAQHMPLDSSQEGLLAQMRRLIGGEVGAPPSLSEIAHTLQTSTRTLRRELRKMNTSYKELVDESRKARAEEWMESNSMPLERLAKGLGFSTVGSFRRAYKRWTGRTPSASRARAPS
jgi:AraC-like DNA-binding protein